MRRRRTWFGKLWFSDVMFGFLVLSYIGMTAFEAWTRWKYKLGPTRWFAGLSAWESDDPLIGLDGGRLLLLTGAALVLGSGRLIEHHPAFSWEYREWLRLTPWHSRMPLPFGQPAFDLGDWWLPVVAVLLCGGDWATSLILLIGVAMGYVLAAVVVCVRCRQPWPAQGLVLGLTFIIHTLWNERLLSAMLAVGVYACARLAIRRSLDTFPWEFLPKPLRIDPRRYQRLGWPWEELLRPSFVERLPLSLAFSVSLLAGWSVFVLGEWFVRLFELRPQPGSNEKFPPAFFVVFLGIGGAMTRLGKYLSGFWWSTGLAGRWATGRWIMPGFDMVLLAPLLTPVSGFAIYEAVFWLTNAKLPAFSVATTLMLLLLLAAGPNERDWKLTGHHRLLASGNKQNRLEEI